MTTDVQETTQEVTKLKQIRLRPEADVFRSKESIRLLLDVPGAKEEDLEVEVHDGVLSVRARVERAEQEVRVYERTFRLDRRMNPAGIEAELQRGVLKLELPFHEEAQPKRIAVKTA